MVGARGDRPRPGSAEFRESLVDCVVEVSQERSAVNEFSGPRSLLDGDCWTTIACRACVWKLRRETQEEHWQEER